MKREVEDTELNLETLTEASHSSAEEEDAKMQKINNLLKMIEAQVFLFFHFVKYIHVLAKSLLGLLLLGRDTQI